MEYTLPQSLLLNIPDYKSQLWFIVLKEPFGNVAGRTYRLRHMERRQRSVSLIIENSEKSIWYRQRLHSLMEEWQMFRKVNKEVNLKTNYSNRSLLGF